MTITKRNDEYGYKRGIGAYSKEDSAFSPGSKHKYDLPGVKTKESVIFAQKGPGGDFLPGGSALPRGGPPRYKPKTGPGINAQKPK